MIRHIALLRFNDGTTPEHRQLIRDALGALPDKIPAIRSYRYGEDIGLNAGNYEFAVVGDFDDDAAFVAYRDHPLHQALVKDLLNPVLAQRAAVQFSWEPALPSDLPA